MGGFGPIVAFVALILNVAAYLYLFALLARMVLDLIPAFNRGWRPKGAMLVLAEVVYTITDPPIRFFRRIIPPLRLGPVALDLGFSITFFLIVIIVIPITGFFARQ